MTINSSERPGRSEPFSSPGRRFATVVTIVGASVLFTGCGGATPTPRPTTQATEPSRPTPLPTSTPEVTSTATMSPGSQVAMPQLPADFPVPPGAEQQQTDDEQLIARWRLDDHGSVAYDFYVDALPAAGYPITLTAPGGGAAIIRFETGSGEIWQIEIHEAPDDPLQTIVKLGLERP